MHRLTLRILDVINAFQNKNVPIQEIFCASPSPYCLDLLKKNLTFLSIGMTIYFVSNL